jgi:hypothetical protein
MRGAGPWYECWCGPNAEDVRGDILNSFEAREKLFNFAKLSKYIDRIVPITRDDFGSWRGYTSFRMKEKLIKQIELLYDEEIARNKINKFIMNSCWVQDMLYRPPTEDKPSGRMYATVETHFNQMVSENIPKQSLSEI